MKSAGRTLGFVVLVLAVALRAAARGMKPALKPDGRRVTGARKAASEQVDRDLAAIAQGVPELRLLARAELDICSRGRSDWKTRDAWRRRSPAG